MSESSASPRLAFIGGGNMARALIGGLLRRGWPAERIVVSEPVEAARAALAAEFGIAAHADNLDSAQAADVLLLAVKPQLMRQVCEPLAALAGARDPLVVSIAAGIGSASLRQWLGGQARVIRCMPNTPALIGLGITALCAADARIGTADRALATELLAAVGDTLWLDDESLLDAVTAVSGSGPAYFFALMEGLVAGAEAQGLAPEVARQLVLKTALGAASLALAGSESPAVLRERVTSPGGTTAAALAVFEQAGLQQVAAAAVAAATRRGVELARHFG